MKVNYKILDMQNKMYTKIVKGLLLLAVVFLGTINAMGQVQDVMTKIKDGTKTSSRIPVTGAILELESNNKGFLTPRMTTIDRDNINLTKANEGMLIFNTDTGCFNYFDVAQSEFAEPKDPKDPKSAIPTKKVWLSICGTPPPAIFYISQDQCKNMTLPQNLKQGDPLKASDYISLSVTVEQAGTYTILAMTKNGYYFSTEGTFHSTGTYSLVLKGEGNPFASYKIDKNNNNKKIGDIVTFQLNGKISKDYDCNDKEILVNPTTVSYRIICGENKKASGKYLVGIRMGQQVTEDEVQEITFNVSHVSQGTWVVKSDKVNGIQFEGKGEFTSEEANEDGFTKEITLKASGTPIKPGKHTFTLSSNAAPDPENNPTDNKCKFTVEVSDVELKPLCADTKTKAHGTYTQDVDAKGNYITLEVDVEAPGRTFFETEKIGDLEFRTENPIIFTKRGIHTIALQAVGTPTVVGDNEFTVSAYKLEFEGETSKKVPHKVFLTDPSSGLHNPDDPTKATSNCKIKVKVVPQPVTFTMVCNSIQEQGIFSPHTPLTSDNTLDVLVVVKYPGKVKIETDKQNGVSFIAEVDLPVGEHTVSLIAKGEPESGGPFSYTVTGYSSTGEIICPKEITYLYRKINILGLGNGIYQPSSSDGNHSSRKILKYSGNFGPNGTVKVQEMNIVQFTSNENITPLRLKQLIDNNNVDIIFIGYNFVFTSNTDAVVKVLEDFVKEKKGFLIHSQENTERTAQKLVDAIVGPSDLKVINPRGLLAAKILNVNDRILDGPFGDARGHYMANDGQNGLYFTDLPDTMTGLSTYFDATDKPTYWMVKHNDLGYVFASDAGWATGLSNNTSTQGYPSGMDFSGKPVSKPYRDRTGPLWDGDPNLVTFPTYNSIVYANLFTVAIEYVTKHTDTNYKFIPPK